MSIFSSHFVRDLFEKRPTRADKKAAISWRPAAASLFSLQMKTYMRLLLKPICCTKKHGRACPSS